MAFPSKDFPKKILFEIYNEGRFFSQLVGFLRFRNNIATRNIPSKIEHYVRKKKLVFLAGAADAFPLGENRRPEMRLMFAGSYRAERDGLRPGTVHGGLHEELTPA